MSRVEVFVSLLGEDVEVWRPVQAEAVNASIYRLCEQPYDRATETWQFEPGALVVCEELGTEDGRILAAVRPAEGSQDSV